MNTKLDLTKEERAKNSKLKTRYGIDLGQYLDILKKQDYKCAICGKRPKPGQKALGVDHNHKTGHTRGLLCVHCNTNVLKYLRDDKVLYAGLASYLMTALLEDKEWIK